MKRFCLIGLVLMMFSTLTSASQAPNTGVQWLEKMITAINQSAYSGTIVVLKDDQLFSAKLSHQFTNEQVQEQIVQQNGVIAWRKGQNIRYFKAKDAPVDQRYFQSPLSKFSKLDAKKLSKNYQINIIAGERFITRDAVILQLANDEWHYQQKLWLDAKTGLLLKQETLNEALDVVEKWQFLDVNYQAQKDSKSFFDEKLIAGYEQQLLNLSPMTVNYTVDQKLIGWLPSGYELVSAQQYQYAQRLFYQDGLSSFSILVEKINETRKSDLTVNQVGSTVVAEFQDKHHLLLLVGDIPKQTATKVIRNINPTLIE